MFYGIYTFKELNNKISGFGKYIKPFKELRNLVDKIYNETYGFNRLVETAINHEIFCTSINVDFFNEELRKLLNKVNINFDIRPGVLEEYISFNAKNKTFAKFSTIGNYKKTKKFKVDSRIFIEAVKRVLEKYYNTHIKPVKNNSDDSNDWWDDWCEAKKEEVGQNLSTVEEQSSGYANAKLKHLNNQPLPFVYVSTGEITKFTNYKEPKPRSREIFSFHRPETLLKWFQSEKSLRSGLLDIPELPTLNLRDCQIDAITNLEKSFKDFRPKALVQMATGSGKTFTAITAIYRAHRTTSLQASNEIVGCCSLQHGLLYPLPDVENFSPTKRTDVMHAFEQHSVFQTLADCTHVVFDP
jgi:hypothetical protein